MVPSRNPCFGRLFTALLVAGLLSAATDAGAASGSNNETKKLDWRVPTHIQLTPMLVPIEYPNQTTTVVTFYLEALDAKYVGAICSYVPRIRDAIMRILSRDPIPVKRRKLQLDHVPEQLIGPINSSLDEQMIDAVYVSAGAVRMEGGSISRLPFARINGCRTIKKMQDELRKAKEAQKKK